jgi:hypothetical protein
VRYLLAPEMAVLLSKVPDLKKRFFIDTLWNTGGRRLFQPALLEGAQHHEG